MTTTMVTSFCRACTAYCPITVTVTDGRVTKVDGDVEAPEYDGYTCPKGRALPEVTHGPGRLIRSMKRKPDGSFQPIGSQTAVQEIATKLRQIIQEHGPRAVALYIGNGTTQHPFGVVMGSALLQALGSPMFFTPTTIDKPAEKISAAMHGHWIAGGQSFEESDTWMLIGANPVISKSNGVPYNNPGMRLKQAVARGLKLIVVDPRRSDCARRAHVHLQALPGEDPTILAGMIRIIIAERLYDSDFLAENVAGFDALKAAVEPYTPEYVAERAGIAQADLIEAARTFGRAKRGMAICATGPSFSMRSNLSFYLAHCLNSICGRWAKAGERAVYPNVLLPAFTPKAQPLPPTPYFGKETMRVMGLRESLSGMPTAALCDEILLEGPGQVKALICLGANPVSAFPDQRKAEQAMGALELLVSLDVTFSATAKLAHYVVAPPTPLEQPGLTYLTEAFKYTGEARGFQNYWAQYTPPVVSPPAGSDVMPEHEFFFRVAQELGLSLTWTNYFGLGKFIECPTETYPLDMSKVPDLDDLFELATTNSRVPLEEVKKHPHGKNFDIDVKVAPRDADCTARLDVGNASMMEELVEVRSEDFRAKRQNREFPFTLVCRRANHVLNSIGTDLPGLQRARSHNPIYMNPQDMAATQLQDGSVVRIRSKNDTVLGIAEADESLRPGVVAMTHGYGARGPAAELDPRLAGTNVNLLMHLDEYDPITGIPRMSDLPVAITAQAH
ncbi:MAG: molybdopterin-dependent oxidoreductase [Pseudomonadota bacterium]